MTKWGCMIVGWSCSLVITAVASAASAQPAAAQPPAAEPAASPAASPAALGQQPPPATQPAAEPSVDLSGGAPLQTPAPPPPNAGDEPEDEPEDEPPEMVEEVHGGTQRNFGFGPRIAGISGFGAGVRTGFRYFGFDIAGGWQPLFPTVPRSADPEDDEAEFFNSWQLNLTAYVAFNPDSTFVAGATTGYVYNSVFGRGVALAFDGVLNLSNHFGIQFLGGPAIYPDAADRLREAAGLTDTAEFTDPGPALQIGIGAGLIIYP